MDLLTAIREVLRVIGAAAREAQAIRAQGEAVRGEAIVRRMHARYESAKRDPAVKGAAGG
jgi:hypothetical protein